MTRLIMLVEKDDGITCLLVLTTETEQTSLVIWKLILAKFGFNLPLVMTSGIMIVTPMSIFPCHREAQK